MLKRAWYVFCLFWALVILFIGKGLDPTIVITTAFAPVAIGLLLVQVLRFVIGSSWQK